MSIITNGLFSWLIEGEPWIEYRARIELLDQPEDHPEAMKAYHALCSFPPVSSLIDELSEWPGPILKSHKQAGHFLHKLVFLADLGLRRDHPGIKKVVQRIIEHRSPERLFQVLVNIHPRWGGSGEDEFAWMLCDAPLVIWALVKFGIGKQQIYDSLEFLIGLQRENGWPCAVSSQLGKFRGPGSKADPCPYANLVMLQLLSQFPEKHTDPAVQTGVEAILSLWEQRNEKRPYLFAMGTDFSKLKTPLIWYDILHVTDVLTQFPWALRDERLRQMIEVLRSKSDQDGKYTPESVWLDWKRWEFGQKKVPSKWITLLAQRILKRSEAVQ